MSTLQLCREPISLQAPITLGIHSNVAGSQFDFTSGHAWISATTEDGTIYYFGLWPDGHPRVSNRSKLCTDVRIGMETGSRPLASRYYRLDSQQVSALNKIINKPEVWGYTNNCSNWAVQVLREVIGIRFNSSDYLIFSTPRALGEAILSFEKRQPTSPMLPHLGPPLQEQWSSMAK